jgi:hypothetical protein
VCHHLRYLLLPHLLRLWHVAYVLPIGIHKWQVTHTVWIWTEALLAYYFSTACMLMKPGQRSLPINKLSFDQGCVHRFNAEAGA